VQRNVAEKKILASNWGLKKNSCPEKLPNPPLKYLIVRPLVCSDHYNSDISSVRQIYTKFATLQGYIFRILQHFATKLCNFTNFSMLFPGIYFFAKIKAVYNGNCLLFISPKDLSGLSTIQFRLSFKGHKSLEYCCLACVAGGIRGHERMGSLKYRLPKNDTF
jgi:hypothetical protein